MMTRRHFALASAAALAGGAAGSISAAPIPKDFDTVFPQGPVNPYGKFFTGTSYLTMLNTEPVFNCPIGNVTFEPGCRTFWHKHTGGQILLVLAGAPHQKRRRRSDCSGRRALARRLRQASHDAHFHRNQCS